MSEMNVKSAIQPSTRTLFAVLFYRYASNAWNNNAHSFEHGRSTPNFCGLHNFSFHQHTLLYQKYNENDIGF